MAIEEQYLPDAADGALPHTETGRVLAAADKVDNLTVSFALGKRPTGSRDPLGLRRAAIGLCRLAIEAGLEIDVKALVARDLELLSSQNAAVKDDPSDVSDFVFERLEGLLDVPVEFVRAARASGLEDIGAVARLAEALAAAVATDEFAKAFVAYDRTNRLAGTRGRRRQAARPQACDRAGRSGAGGAAQRNGPADRGGRGRARLRRRDRRRRRARPSGRHASSTTCS